MTRFRDDNTEGYTSDDLKSLNVAYEAAAQKLDPDDAQCGSFYDYLSEVTLLHYDNGLRGKLLVNNLLRHF